MLATLVAEKLRERRRALDIRRVGGILAVEQAQRIAQCAIPCLPAHLRKMRCEVLQQGGAILRTAVLVAERVEIERRIVDSVTRDELPRERDHLEIGLGSGESKTFDSELMRLPVAASLRSLVAKDRSDVIEA